MQRESKSSIRSKQTTGYDFQTLVEMLRRRAEMQPDFIGWTFLEDGETETSRLSYRSLYEQACAVAANLQEQGVKPGDRAMLTYRPGIDFVVGFFGCLLAEVIAVPAYPPGRSRINRGLSRLLSIIADAQPSALLTTADALPLAQKVFSERMDLSSLKWFATNDLDPAASPSWKPTQVKKETLAFLQYTSGSTGTPRGVMLKHSNLLHNAWMVYESFNETEQDVYLSWLPIFHDMGFMAGVLQPLYASLRVVLMPPAAFLQRPLRWMEAISKYRATISGGPNFAYELCARRSTPAERASLDLSRWRIAFNGAEPVRADTLERFANTFAESGFRREALYPCYGLAEATLIVSGGRPGEPPLVHSLDAVALNNKQIIDVPEETENAKAVVGCGHILMDQKVVIANPESMTTCATGEVGEIWVAGKSIAEGYWGRPGESAECFKAHLTDTGEGPFLRTGDAGAMLNGQLFIAGRLKDLIIIRGVNHYPQDIEFTAENSHPALRPGSNAAFSIEVEGEEQLVIVQEVNVKTPLDYQEIFPEIRRQVSLNHDLQVYGVLLIEPGAILKTSSGKIQRQATRKAYLEGAFNPAAEWRLPPATAGQEGDVHPRELATQSDFDMSTFQSLFASQTATIQNWMSVRLAGVLRIGSEQIDVNQPIVRYGLDSLAAIELTHSLETNLGVRLSASDLLQDVSIAQLAAEAVKQMANKLGVPDSPSTAPLKRQYPLSHGQRGLWFLRQLAPESAAYNIVRAVRFGSDVNAAALQRAFGKLVGRHPALRTTYAEIDSQPVQRISEELTGYWSEIDAERWNEEELQSYLLSESIRPFDLQQGPLFRATLFSRATGETVMLLAVHHIIADFWSLTILLRELGIFYAIETGNEMAEPPALTAHYSDFVRWQGETVAGSEGERLKRYWEKQLAGEPPTLDLPTARSRPPQQTFCGDSYSFKLSADLTAKLRELSKAEGATLYVTLLAAFQTLLHRYTGQNDIVVGSPVMGRKKAEWGQLVGYFVNPLVMRTLLSGSFSFLELISQVRKTVLEAFDHQDYPFSLLVENLQPERDLSRSPLFQTMFVLQKGQGEDGEKLSLFALGESGAQAVFGGLRLESVALKQRIAQFDLTLMMADAGDNLAASFEFNTDLFDREVIERMAGHFRCLLESIIKNPKERIENYSLLPPSETEQIVVAWNDTAEDYGSGHLLYKLIEAQIERTPESTALVFGAEQLSYRQLNEQANRLANYLCSLGVGPDSVVGICAERSVEMVAGLLAILKAGGAYLPLDPAYPADRLRFMAADAGVSVILTQARFADLFASQPAAIFRLDSDSKRLNRCSIKNPTILLNEQHLAYVIYTSGSTGRPKGVMVSHGSICNRVLWMLKTYPLASGQKVLQKTPYSFDVSVCEFFWPLAAGATLIIAQPEGHKDPQYLIEIINERGVTDLHFVPSMLQAFIESAGPTRCPSLERVVCSGEALPAELLQRFYASSTASLNNLYGPTEAAVDVTYWPCPRESQDLTLPIGRPIANTQIYLLDENLQPTPAGVPGELFIGGFNLARGYLNRPGLTTEKFIPNLFGVAPGARLYRTGDLARFRPDGQIEYLGRLDFQVKIRGFRIEIGEIEAVLNEHPAIGQSIITVSEGTSGDKRLVAYLTAESGAKIDIADLRRRLKERLPDYMTPSQFIVLTSWPLTQSGKVDRKALPLPESLGAENETEKVAPRSPLETAVATIWEETLGLPHVGIYDNFFELGGHSLLATQIISRLRQTFGVEIPLRAVFENPTVHLLAQRAADALSAASPAAHTRLPLRPVSRAEALPLSFAQQRLWFIDQLEPGNPFYNVPGAVRLSGRLDVKALQASINCVAARHEVLRTRFASTDGNPIQIIEPRVEIELDVTDLRQAGSERAEAELDRLARAEAAQPFDLSRAPLMRARLLRLAEDDQVLLVVMHHIVSDGWSVGVFVRELAEFYSAAVRGESAALPELPVQYADYAVWQREAMGEDAYQEQARYWKERLLGASDRLDLPTDRPRPNAQSHRGSQLKLRLQPELTEKLKTLSRKEGVTLFMTLLAGFKTLLHHYTGQEDIIVGSDIANRTRVEIEGLIGFLSNMMVLRTDLSENPSFRELLGRVKEVSLGAYAHQDLTFEKLVEEIKPKRELSHAPLFQIVFTLQNAPRQTYKLDGLEVDIYAVDSGTAKFDLVINLWESGEALSGLVEYSTDLFDKTTIERLLSDFESTLASAVENPDRRMAELSPLSDAQKHEMLVEWNQTQQPYPSHTCIHELIEAQVIRTPDAPAVSCDNEVVSFSEMNARANQLAHYLVKQGVHPGARVGVYMRHSAEVVISLLAILKTGGAYVPLEPAHPSARSEFIIADAELKLILTQSSLVESLPKSDARVLPIDAERLQISEESSSNPRDLAAYEATAYVIYTSGSTGRPKGVQIGHQALVNYICWAIEAYVGARSLNFALYSSLAFDLTVTSIYVPLVTGNQIIIHNWEEREAPLGKILNDRRVDVLKLTPSHLSLIKDQVHQSGAVGRLIVGGEALEENLARRITEGFGGDVQIFNEYGPTEATVGCMLYRYDPNVDQRPYVPIGRPSSNTQIYLLDRWQNPTPPNVFGELYIAGDALAQGYLKRPDLTAASFLPNPFTADARMYKTGDLARRLPNGELEFIGRRDEQVKFHGYRVELNEIQTALNQHSQIRESLVLLHTDQNQTQVMAAYYVSRQEIEVGALREFLSGRIIEETIPNLFVHLRRMPLTLNGKINREALPTLEEIRQKLTRSYTSPQTPIEQGVASIWEETLGLPQVGIYDNFFELGGHSLLATRITSRLRQTFGVEIPLRAVFENPTVHLLAQRVADALSAASPAAHTRLPLRPVPRAEALPLSFAQQRLWFIDQLEPGNPFYNVPGAVRLRGRLDVKALQASINCVAARHEVLRTRFASTDGNPVQIIEPRVEIELDVTDLRQAGSERAETELDRLARAEAAQPFDLSRAPLMRARLLRLAEDDQVLLVVMHHIVSDGWSVGVFVRELAEFYGAAVRGERAALPEAPVQYADYAVWQREAMGEDAYQEQARYWKERLLGAGERLDLPTDRPRPPIQSYRGATETVQIPALLHDALHELSQRENATLFMTLLAGFQALLYRYTGQRCINVGTPIAGRTHQELEGLIGFFVNTLVLSTRVEGDRSFIELLRQVKETATEAYAHQDLPFERLVEEAAPERSLSYAPLFQVLFVLQNAPRHELAVEGLTAEMTAIENGTTKYDLSFSMEENENALTGRLTYSTDLFEATTIKRMLSHFVNLLEGVLAAPDAPLAQIDFLTANDRRSLLAEWNSTAEDLGPDLCMQDLFENQAATKPSSIAVVYEDQSLTFAELDRRANQLAHHLRALGVKTEDRVGLFLKRSPKMIVSMLAVLKAGGAYVSLDPLYPGERIAYMLHDAQARVLLTETELLARVPDCGEAVICLDRDAAEINSRSAARPVNISRPMNLAYVLYTSGSTGRPKGVAVEHRQIVHYTRSVSRRLGLTGDLSYAVASTPAADLGYTMIFPALANGGCLHVISAERAADAELLADYFERRPIDCLKITPSHLGALLNSPRAASLPPHEVLTLGGEMSSWELIGKINDLKPGVRVFNHYGPTETTVGVITNALNRDAEESNSGSPLLGRPIHNVRIYILDEKRQPVPVGVSGELYVGGAAVSRGYLSVPALTAEKFVADPFSAEPGGRLYRTGDIARYRADGWLEFLGRADHQIKVRGFRIELGEIEAAIEQQPFVQQCVVVAREETSGDRLLAAYVVPKAGQHVDAALIRQRLRSALPEYMTPSVFITLDALPLTPNGKVDRAALPAPNKVQEELNRGLVAPRTPIETGVAAVWSELLKTPQIGVHENFFDLGGHSLLVTQVVSRLRQIFQVELPMRALFEGPTIAETAARIEALLTSSEIGATTPIVRGEKGANALQPLSFAQQRLWLLAQLEPDNPFYNVPAAIRMSGKLNVTALHRSINQIVVRHEILRTVFRRHGTQPVQVVLPELSIDIPVTDLSRLNEAERESAIERLAREEAARTFDLEAGPLMRVKLLALESEEHVLLATLHHIISDAWSTGLFIREIAALYEANSSDQEALLPELPLQYADYAAWQRERLRGDVLDKLTDYWKERLGDAAQTLDLPADYARPARLTYHGADCEIRLSPIATSELKSLSRKEGVTLFMTMLAALYTLLHRYTDQKDISIGTPIAGRNQAELESLIGFFINMLVLRVDLDGDPTFRDLMHRVKEVCLGAYMHQEMPFEKLVEELQPERDLSRNPLAQVVFTMHNTPETALALSGLRLKEWDAGQETRFDLEFHFREQGEESQIILTYSTDLFSAASVGLMGEHFQRLLESIVANPDQKLSELRLLSEREESLLVTEWNSMSRDYPDDQCIHELFTAQVERTPDAVALIEGEHRLSYAEVNRRANQLAHCLQKHMVGAESRIGVMLDRSIEGVVSFLGVLKAGGVYVPMDPSYPIERLEFMLSDTGSAVCLTKSTWADKVSAIRVITIRLDDDWAAIEQEPETEPRTNATAEHLAYVMYTSGSTGSPKGVAVTHKAVNRLVHNTNYVHFSDKENFAHISNVTFDAATFEIWGALLHGGKLTILKREVVLSPSELARQIAAQGISAMFITAALFNQIAQIAPQTFRAARYVLVGGDVAEPESYRRILLNGAPENLCNAYGPTENTTFSAWHPVTEVAVDEISIPIGGPIANSELFVLDENFCLSPIGVDGELFLGGDGLARNYYNRPALTAEKFVPHPFARRGGERLYRTGDLTRRRPDGAIRFLGRIDHQVKIRGFRVETGEIEAILSRHPLVKDCAVIACSDRSGGKQLNAYIAPLTTKGLKASGSNGNGHSPAHTVHGAPPAEQADLTRVLRGYLQARMPEYMIPSAFVLVEEMPLNANRKVDRRALAAIETHAATPKQGFVAPQSLCEEKLARIWAETLGVSQVSMTDNFFDLGGHSLTAMQAISRIDEIFKIELPMRAIFEAQTIVDLAERVEELICGAPEIKPASIERVPRTGRLPLSFAQQRLWFLDQLRPGSVAYTIPGLLRVTGRLNVQVLEKTLSEIYRRHESLRTNFVMVDGEATQIIHPSGDFALDRIDCSALEPGRIEAAVQDRIREQVTRPFDLAKDKLFCCCLLKISPTEHVLMILMHHIISDGWSMDVLLREIATLSAAFAGGGRSPLDELPIQYADFAHWQRGWLSGDRLGQQMAYWRERLAGAPATLGLPTDRPRPPIQTTVSEKRRFTLPDALRDRLAALSRDEGATLFMTLLAGYKTLLYRYSGQEDIVIGAPIANRNRSEIENLIGFFVNMLVLRTNLGQSPTFRELIGRVKETALGAYAHQDLPFEKLVEDLQPERDLSHTPFFQATFVLQTALQEKVHLPDVQAELMEHEVGQAKFDMILAMSDTDQGLTGTLEYNRHLFDATTIDRLIGHFVNLLEEAAADPDLRIGDFQMLSAVERQRMLAEWNDTQAPFPAEHCLPQLFEQRAARRPEAIALVSGDIELSYGALNARANQLAHFLRAQGIGPESVVGLCVERSPETLIGLLGIMKSGGAYLPLDPTYPSERLNYMLEDANVKLLLTQQSLRTKPPGDRLRVVCLDSEWDDISRWSQADPEPLGAPENLAYIIYTSGSTGRPKGTMVQHRGLSNLTEAQLVAFGIEPQARILQFASLSFDASIFEIAMALRSGARLYMVSGEASLSGHPLAVFLKQQDVTHVTLPPSVLALLPETSLPALRTIIVAGEACPADLVNRWAPGRRFFNAYGPTEATVWASVAECAAGEQPPSIGEPIINARIHVIDANLQPAPVGSPGELLIGGEGVARGYLGRPGLTAEKFIPDPFGVAPGRRLYRSGDLAHYFPKGEICFLGRIDHQVKLRGFRIELGEIETALKQATGVRDAVVLAQSGPQTDNRLLGFILPQNGEPIKVKELRDHLRGLLPDYMIPAAFHNIEEIPLTTNGKVDRQALFQLSAQTMEDETEYIAPRNEVERQLAKVWQEVLQLEKVGIDESFFDLGGHSLLMVTVQNKLKEVFKKDVSITEFFKHPTIRMLSRIFTEEQAPKAASQSMRERAMKQKEAALRKKPIAKPLVKKTQ